MTSQNKVDISTRMVLHSHKKTMYQPSSIRFQALADVHMSQFEPRYNVKKKKKSNCGYQYTLHIIFCRPAQLRGPVWTVLETRMP